MTSKPDEPTVFTGKFITVYKSQSWDYEVHRNLYAEYIGHVNEGYANMNWFSPPRGCNLRAEEMIEIVEFLTSLNK